jgi:8-oxo-dGTP pyrophosphatase MutT (NUDIX family)
MVVDDRPDLHVLLLRRREASAFVPNMDVFPGGGVDAEDGAADPVAGSADGPSDVAASACLGLAQGGRAYWVAAAREAHEESGLRLALGDLFYTARWITPAGPPRRYDTRFFVTALPAGQTPVADRREAVHAAWVRPTDALADFTAGRRAMLPPTVGMLRILASYASSAQVIEAAARAQTGPDHRVELAAEGAGKWRVLLPGEPLAPKMLETEAWVRLCPRAREV